MVKIDKGISVVVPVKDEEENIKIFVEEIIEIGLPEIQKFEIVFIDDGSKDKTPDIIRELSKTHNFIKLYQMKKNVGKSAAWHLGFSNAQYEIIVTMDGDLQNDPHDIETMYETLIEGYDLVSGKRKRRADTISRKIQSRIANNVRRFFLKDNADDSGCGIKMFRKECVKKISMFNGCHRFWEALFNLNGFKVKQILVNDRRRKFGVPKYGLKNRSIKPLIDMLGVFWMRRRNIFYDYKEINSEKKDVYKSSKQTYL